MIDEAKMTNPSELSPRAAIALLSLQLRSTVQDAAEAEAEADAIDTDAALWQLRSRLTPLIEDRRRALDEEVSIERERAAAQIADAHAEADRIVAAAVEAAAARRQAAERAHAEEQARVAEQARAAAAAAALVPPPPPPQPSPVIDAVPALLADSPASDTPADTSLFDDPMLEWAPDADAPAAGELELLDLPVAPESVDSAWAPQDDSAVPAMLLPPTTMPMPRVGPEVPPLPEPPVELDVVGTANDVPVAMHVVIDAESFARAFAAALAPVIEARQQPQYQPPVNWTPYQPPAPAPKKSFWSHAWHPDVLLSGLAMVIVVIVLIAWAG